MDFKPLEFSDFSGGITENILQADPRRYEKADNFLITVDKKLLERDAIIPFSRYAYTLPGTGNSSVNIFLSAINESILLPGTGRTMFSYDGLNWSKILGVAGNDVLQGGDNLSQVQAAEFQRVIYLTSDGLLNSQGIRPSKMYRNEDNTWTARTAGLPRSYASGLNDSDLLAACIGRANDLRAKFISHFSDAQNTLFYSPPVAGQTTGKTALHINLDKLALCYLIPQSFNPVSDPQVPNPIPTPAPDATNEATLYTLVQALNNAYTAHTADAVKSSAQSLNTTDLPFYHQDIRGRLGVNFLYRVYKGPLATLANVGKPSTLVQAATMINDLMTKYNWHRKAVFTHDFENDPAHYDQYGLSYTQLDLNFLGKVPFKVTPDWGDVIGYVNNLRFLYKAHSENIDAFSPAILNAQYGHKIRDNFSPNLGAWLGCTMPEANNIYDAYNLLYWLRVLYWTHQQDALFPTYVAVQATHSAGSSALTLVRDLSGNNVDILAALGGVTRARIWARFGGYAPNVNQYDQSGAYTVAYVTASSSANATLDRVSTSSGNIICQATISMYHNFGSNYVDGSLVGHSLVTSAVSAEVPAASMATPPYQVGNSASAWMQLANEMFFAFTAHVQNPLTHSIYNSGAIPNFVQTLWNSYISRVPYPPFFPAEVGNYGYASHWVDEYTVEPNGIDYQVVSNPVFTASMELPKLYPVGTQITSPYPTYYPNFTITNQRSNLLSEIPVITNDTTTNYAVSDLKLAIYRTTDGGNTYYKETELANGTTSYSDSLSDTVPSASGEVLTGGTVLYTSGGVVGFDQPPVCKYIHNFGGTVFYGAVVDADQYFPNRILQAIPNTPDAAPATFTYDLEDELTGLSSSRSNLIALCKNSLYRISGGFNLQGQGALIAEKISDAMGNLNAKGIVRTEIGVFFAGTDGFYYTDGFQIIKISIDLDKTYAKLTASDSQKRAIIGSYDKIGRRIFWSLKTSETDTAPSVTYIYHVDYGVKPSGAFTTMSNGLNYRPTSMVHRAGVMYVGHEKGAVLKTYPHAKADAAINYLLTTGIKFDGTFRTYHIPYHYKSVAVDMGTTFNRKWLTKVHIVGQNQGDMLLQSYALRDLNQTQQGKQAMAPVNYRGNAVWGDPRCVWGNPAEKWEYDGKMDLWRRFPKNTLRSDFMQLELLPYNGVVYSSSQDYPEGVLAQGDDNIVSMPLSFPPYTDLRWPRDIEGMTLYTSLDEYTTGYPILTVATNFFTIDGSVGFGTQFEWEIRGYKKEQRVSLSSMLIHFTYLGNSNQAYPGPNTGNGPGNMGGNPS